MSDIISQFKTLKGHGMAECYAEIQAQGQAGGVEAIASATCQLLAAEATDRSIRAIRYQMSSAKFPIHRDLLGFEFCQSKVDQQLINKLGGYPRTNVLVSGYLYVVGESVKR